MKELITFVLGAGLGVGLLMLCPDLRKKLDQGASKVKDKIEKMKK